MRPLCLILSLITALLSFAACERGSNNHQTKELAVEENKPTTEGWGSAQDASFLLEAYSYGLMIIQYSELAQQKAQTPALKSFAEQSANWHQKMNKDVAQQAAKKEVALPKAGGDDVQKFINELSALPADKFEQRYLQALHEIQRKMIKQYELAAEGALDQDLRTWANQTLPYLQGHAQAVDELSSQLKNQ